MDHEPIHVSFREERVQVTVTEERLEFSSPLLLAAPVGAGLGSTSNRVDGIPAGVPAILDRLVFPATSLAVKWLLFLADRETGLAVSSEINVLRRGGQVWFYQRSEHVFIQTLLAVIMPCSSAITSSQTRNPHTVTNHLNFCMMAISLTWIYAAKMAEQPQRRHQAKVAAVSPSPISDDPSPRSFGRRISPRAAPCHTIPCEKGSPPCCSAWPRDSGLIKNGETSVTEISHGFFSLLDAKWWMWWRHHVLPQSHLSPDPRAA